MDDVFDIQRVLAQERYRLYVDRAKEQLAKLFEERSDQLFYERQLQVSLEDVYFHWVTSKALKELVDEKRLKTQLLKLRYKTDTGGPVLPDDWDTGANVRFYWSVGKRYWRRAAAEVLKLIREYSEPDLTRAYGRQAEMLFDAALPKAGFSPVAEHTNSYPEKRWSTTGHNLDRIFERDGVGYGVEIKNQLKYIEPVELKVKLDMCKFLGLRPLFIVRMMPKLYNHEIIRNWGGFVLIFKYQLYPFHMGEFARLLREKLGLPVDCPASIEAGTIARLLKWHLGELAK